MSERLGFGLGFTLLWSAGITDILGVPPADVGGRDGPEWTEEQFQEICQRLSDRALQARARSIEDNDL